MKFKPTTPSKIEELREKHREVKKDLLRIIEVTEHKQVTKATIKDMMFKLYLKIK